MKDKILPSIPFDVVVHLPVRHSTERDHRERLSLPPGKHRRPMRTRQHPDLTGDGPNGINGTAIDAQTPVKNVQP